MENNTVKQWREQHLTHTEKKQSKISISTGAWFPHGPQRGPRQPCRAAGLHSPLMATAQCLLLLPPGDRYNNGAGQVPYDA